MQHTPRTCLVALLVLGTFLPRLISATSGDGYADWAELKGAAFDAAFLSRMIQHHNHGVHLAQTAAQYAQREEIRQFAAEVTITQMKEVRELETLRTGSDTSRSAPVAGTPRVDESTITEETAIEPLSRPAPPHMDETASEINSPKDRGDREKLTMLAASNRFDEDFLREMTRHYTTGLAWAELARERASARAVKDLGATLARQQSVELMELQRLQGAR